MRWSARPENKSLTDSRGVSDTAEGPSRGSDGIFLETLREFVSFEEIDDSGAGRFGADMTSEDSSSKGLNNTDKKHKNGLDISF